MKKKKWLKGGRKDLVNLNQWKLASKCMLGLVLNDSATSF